MQTITYIFVNREKTIFDKLLGWLINAFEHGENFASHVAIQFEDLNGYGPCILEALSSGVVIAPYNKYDDTPKQYKLALELTDEEYSKFEDKAVEIILHKYRYSYKSVIIGGISDSLSRRLARVLAIIFKATKDDEMDCSENGTVLIQTIYPSINTDDDETDAQITPFRLFFKMLLANLSGNLKIIAIKKL